MHDAATGIDPLSRHPACGFATRTAEERLEDLSAKIALVLELRQARR
jgi:hypothetical protein